MRDTIYTLGLSLAARGLPALVIDEDGDDAMFGKDDGSKLAIREAKPTDGKNGGIRFQQCGGGRRILRSTKRFAS